MRNSVLFASAMAVAFSASVAMAAVTTIFCCIGTLLNGFVRTHSDTEPGYGGASDIRCQNGLATISQMISAMASSSQT